MLQLFYSSYSDTYAHFPTCKPMVRRVLTNLFNAVSVWLHGYIQTNLEASTFHVQWRFMFLTLKSTTVYHLMPNQMQHKITLYSFKWICRFMADWHRSRELRKGQSQQIRKENEVNIWELITCKVKVYSWKDSGAIYSTINLQAPRV